MDEYTRWSLFNSYLFSASWLTVFEEVAFQKLYEPQEGAIFHFLSEYINTSSMFQKKDYCAQHITCFPHIDIQN